MRESRMYIQLGPGSPECFLEWTNQRADVPDIPGAGVQILT